MYIPEELFDQEIVLEYLKEIPDLEVIRDGDFMMMEESQMERLLKVHLHKLRTRPAPPIFQQYLAHFPNGPYPGMLLKLAIYSIAIWNLKKCASEPFLPVYVIGMMTAWWIWHHWDLPGMWRFMKIGTFLLFGLTLNAMLADPQQCSPILVIPSLLFSIFVFSLVAFDICFEHEK